MSSAAVVRLTTGQTGPARVVSLTTRSEVFVAQGRPHRLDERGIPGHVRLPRGEVEGLTVRPEMNLPESLGGPVEMGFRAQRFQSGIQLVEEVPEFDGVVGGHDATAFRIREELGSWGKNERSATVGVAIAAASFPSRAVGRPLSIRGGAGAADA